MHEPAYNPSVVPDITRSAPLTARHQQAPRPRRDPYDGLRPWSAITHGAGAVLALVGTAFLLVRAAGLEDWIKFSAFLVYGLSMIGLYTASTLYHCVNTTVRGRLALRKYDHCSIYLLIAGSYTPICMTVLWGGVGAPLLLAIWLCAAALHRGRGALRGQVARPEQPPLWLPRDLPRLYRPGQRVSLYPDVFRGRSPVTLPETPDPPGHGMAGSFFSFAPGG